MIFFISVPVACISSLSSLDSVAESVTFLKPFVDLLTPYEKSILQGVLPPILMSVLFGLLPAVLMQMSKFQGAISNSEIQLATAEKYFLFQIVNGYAIYLVSGSVLSSISQIINSPTSVVSLLANAVPKGLLLIIIYFLI